MDADEPLTIDIDGWEGPLDLLLALARVQKVDLRELSILALVEQYLAYLDSARALQLEVAADYLVMAAWLAYLKSALLLPHEAQPDPDPDDLAMRLQHRLLRLNAMREASARLLARDRLGRDVFLRGNPEGLQLVRRPAWRATLHDLLAAYGAVRARAIPPVHVVVRRPLVTLEEAIERLTDRLGRGRDWLPLAALIPPGGDADYRRSALASGFVAALELARRGQISLAQERSFAPLMVRAA